MASSSSNSEPPPGTTRRRASTGGWSVRPSSPAYRSGQVIAGKYQLQHLIGKGGMGSVWLARNLVLHVDIAIKVVDRKFAEGEAAQRLLVEARAAAKLGHASIVRIHDFGRTDSGDPYIVMELLNGESLEEVIDRKGSLPAVAAVRLLLPIVGALEAAHNKGIIHRDIKPPNIILVAEDSGTVIPKLVDFGIAKVEREMIRNEGRGPDLEEASQLAKRLTQTGTLIGSPEYMAPEQARGDDVDERTDIWALSVVLYEALTGTQPFIGETIDKLLLSILVDTPLPTTEIVEGSDGLWRIVERGLSKNKKERWPSARAMGEALAAWLVDQGCDADMTGASLRQLWLEDRASRSGGAEPSSVSRVMDDLIDRDPLGVRDTHEHNLAIPLTVPHAAPKVPDSTPPSEAPPSPEARPRRALVVGAIGTLLLSAALVGAWAVAPPSQAPAANTAAAAAPSGPSPAGDSAAPATDSSATDNGAESASPAVGGSPPGPPEPPGAPARRPPASDESALPTPSSVVDGSGSTAPTADTPATAEPTNPVPPPEEPTTTAPTATVTPTNGDLPIPDVPNF